MAGVSRGEFYNKVVEFRKSHQTEYLNNLAALMGYVSIDEVFSAGYPISEIEKFSDKASILTWGDNLPKKCWRFNCREICNEQLTAKYGSPQIYFKSEKFVARKIKKMGDTMESLYGYRNQGQSLEHRIAMSKGSNCKNPFASDKFKYNEYIRGKGVLPESKSDFEIYKTKVEELTNINRNLIEFTGRCYYTGQPIYKYDGNKSVNRNDWNMATIDHKISVLAGYLKGLSPEIVADVSNLCWCSKYFNSFKGAKCEAEIRLSGMIERFNEVIKKYYETN